MTTLNLQERYEDVPPDPERIVEGLRDTGYEFNTAIADVVDNSIAASATLVDIRVKQQLTGDIRISIADNGSGMDEDGLRNAMRYGAKRRADLKSLGKFGLGLKTASTAFCRRLMVSSRADEHSETRRAHWDLDHIAKRGHWELAWSTPDEQTLDHLDQVALAGPGTVVVWEKVDRLMKDYADPTGSHASKALQKRVDQLRRHLAMVYQRFLDPTDLRERDVCIKLNDVRVDSWDPFCRAESELVAQDELEVETAQGKNASFLVRAFVLPRREEFSTPEAAAASRLGNDMQGIYIYRENRLLHEADWLGMYQKEPHFSGCRVEFSFGHELDDAFHIDIKKSQIQLSSEIWEYLRSQFLPAPRRAAEQRYRKGQSKSTAAKAKDSHDASNRTIANSAQELDLARVEVKDARTGEVEITNESGVTNLKLKLSTAAKPHQFHVQPVSSIDDGLLWQPALIDGRKAVQINTSHPYYHKVYLPNLNETAVVQGMDSLLWAIASAEIGVISNDTKKHWDDMRFIVSRMLRKLVAELPEPPTDDETA
jgi:hypothetical protein